MGFDVGIFWRELRHGSSDGVGRGYGGELGRGRLGHGELGHGKLSHKLMAEVNGF